MACNSAIYLRLSEHEKKNIAWGAEIEGRSISNYILNLCRNDIRRKKRSEAERTRRLRKMAEFTPDLSTYDLNVDELMEIDDDKFM